MSEDPNAVDTERYYYRPGTTEPELRPEFVAPAEPAAAKTATKTKATPKAAAKAPVKQASKKR